MVDEISYVLQRRILTGEVHERVERLANELTTVSEIGGDSDDLRQKILDARQNGRSLKIILFSIRDYLIRLGVSFGHMSSTEFDWTITLRDQSIFREAHTDDVLAAEQKGKVSPEEAAEFLHTFDQMMDGPHEEDWEVLQTKMADMKRAYRAKQNSPANLETKSFELEELEEEAIGRAPKSLKGLADLLLSGDDLPVQSRDGALFGGADVIVELAATSRTRDFLNGKVRPMDESPGPRVVLSKHAREISWLFRELSTCPDIYLDHMSKYAFFARLANAANAFQIANGELEDSKLVLRAVFMEALRWIEERNVDGRAA